MWQHRVLAIAVVPLGIVGGVIALSIRGMPLTGAAAAAFCLVCGLALVQSWIVTAGIVRATRIFTDVRTACLQGAQTKFKPVFLIGVCVLVGSMPMAFIGAHSGAQAQFATVAVGGVLFSTAGALIAVPVLIAWIGR
jgi:cobalt-zinc-cadmium resistance protein CzcA